MNILPKQPIHYKEFNKEFLNAEKLIRGRPLVLDRGVQVSFLKSLGLKINFRANTAIQKSGGGSQRFFSFDDETVLQKDSRAGQETPAWAGVRQSIMWLNLKGI